MNKYYFSQSKNNYFFRFRCILIALIVLTFARSANAQRIFANSQDSGSTGGLLCIGCAVTNAGNASDGNLQTYSILNATAALLGSTVYQELIFPSSVAANTPVTVKLGSGDHLLSATALGSISVQAYNGSTAIGTPIAASTLLSAASSNNQSELIFTPGQAYDRVRVTLNAGLAGALASINVYEAFYGSGSAGCNTAFDELDGMSAGLLGLGANIGGVQNPQNAIDGDLTTYATLNAGVGAVGGYAQETVIFQKPSTLGDSVRLTLAIPTSLLTAGVLSNVSVQTFNGNTSNNDTQALTSNLLTVKALGLVNIGGTSNQIVTVTFAPSQVFDRVQLQLGGVASVLSTLNFYETQIVIPKPIVSVNAVATNNVQICSGNAVTLVASANAPNSLFTWYGQASGGSPIATGPSFTTPVLTSTTTYYVTASRAGCGVESARTAVTITVGAPPSAPTVAVPSVTICTGQTASFTATGSAGVTFNWYDAATGGNLLFTGATFNTPALNATTSYYVEAQGAGGQCASAARTQVTANVTPALVGPTVASAQICSGSQAVLTATSTQSGVTFNWYDAATGGNLLYTGASFTTPVLTANISYYVEAASGSCTSPTRTQADVTVNPSPVAPIVTTTPANAQVNSGQTVKIDVNSPVAGATYNWYTAATGGSPIATGTSFTTPPLTSNTTYYVETVSATGCTSASRTAVAITVNSLPSTLCDVATSENNGVTGICLLCGVSNSGNAVDGDVNTNSTLSVAVGVLGSVYQTLIFPNTGNKGDTVTVKIGNPGALLSAALLGGVSIQSYNGATSNNDAATISGGLLSLQLLSGGNTALLKFVPQGAFDRVTISLGGLVGALTSVDVYYASKQVAMPVLTATTVNICSGNTATFTVANAFANVTYNWYDASGTKVGTGVSFTTPVLNATTTYYVESALTANGCANPNRASATANVTPSPAVPILASNNVTICPGTSASLQVTNAGNGTVNWYSAASGGSLLFTGATYNVSPTTTTSYYAEITNGTCVSPARTLATVTIDQLPSQPALVASNVQVCSGGTAALQISSPQAGVTYNWYDAATGGNKVGAGSSFTAPAIIANTSYYVEAANASGCINANGRTIANVTISTSPSAPTLSPTQPQVCNGGSVSIVVDNPVAGIQYNWYDAASGGTLLFTGNTYTINNLTATTSFYVEAVNSTGCISASRAKTDITVMPIPSAPTVNTPATGSYSACSGSNVTISINNPQANVVYNWYDAVTGGNLLYTGTQFTTPVITAPTTYYVEAAEGGNCNPSTRTTVPVSVNALPSQPVLQANNVQVCSGNTATVQVSNPQNGVTYNWYDAPTAGNLVGTGSGFITPVLTSNITYYAEAVNSTGCASSSRTPATISINPLPAVPTLTDQAGSTTPSVCSGNPVTLTATSNTPNVTFKWYDAATGGNLLFTGATFTTPALNATTPYYVEAVSTAGCSSSPRASVQVVVNPIPVQPTFAANNVQVCFGSPATLSVASPQAGVTYRWYDSPSKNTLLFTGATYVTNPIVANATLYVEASNGSCTSPSLASVQVTVSTLPSAPVLVNNAITGCEGGQVTLAISNPQSGFTYNWFSAATGGTPLYTGSNFVTPILTANTIYYVEAVNGSGCASSARTAATITVTPSPSAPQLTNTLLAICPGGNIVLTATADPNCTINWYSTPNGGSPIFTGQTFTTPVLTSNTIYYIEAINNTTGCTSKKAIATINMSQPLNAPVVTVGSTSASSATFSWQAVPNAVAYEVSLDNGKTFITPSSGAQGLSHIVNNLQPGQSVSVTVRAIGKDVCEQSPNSGVEAASADNPLGDNVYVPNAFTPNGDGKNDIFMVYGNTIQKLNLSVYDQWGELIFRTTDKSSGWDGTYKGRNQPVGVYVYFVQATLNDGHAVTKKGTITLLR